ncbi:MAG: hypothetical protein WA539_02365, partial [Candidatus Sulfotelmatobacter sp.]
MGRRAAVNARQSKRRLVRITIVVAIIAVVVVLALVVDTQLNPSCPTCADIGQPVPSSVYQQIASVSNSTLANIGLPTSVTPPTSISGTALTVNGKPEILYIGGE